EEHHSSIRHQGLLLYRVERSDQRSTCDSLFGMAIPLRQNTDIAPLPEVPGGFQTIMADPPWQFSNRTGKVAPEHRRLDRYSTMKLDDILAMPVEDVAADNAHLYLWVPNALLPEGI